MSNIFAKVTLDKPSAKKAVLAVLKDSMKVMSEEFLDDANTFAREATGEMISTSYRASKFEDDGLTFVAIWDTDYAREVYYTGTPSSAVNPMASLQWAQKAADTHKKKYEKVLQMAYSK